jgi:hypothetical protein
LAFIDAEGTNCTYLKNCFQVTREQLHYARLEVGQDSVWELFAEDGEMRMYKREEEVDGMVCDPLKALHQVSRVTRLGEFLPIWQLFSLDRFSKCVL